MFEFEEDLASSAKIKVVGVGGGGGNAIRTMMKEEIAGVEFVAINTDVQSLKSHDAMVKIQIGSKLTRGMGSGGNPQIGRDAALEDAAMIREALSGSDMIFITAGMGGGTGTGAAAVIAKVARELGILTVGLVTKPFSFEGRKRMRQAEQGIQFLKDEADTVICIPNDNLLNITGRETPIIDSFKMVDFVLLQAVRSISDLITTPGLINLDFADIRTIMKDGGFAIMGSGTAAGESRALEAAKMALKSPLLENMTFSGATGILLNITGASNMTLFEVNEASKLIQQGCHDDANIIFGTVIDETMGDKIRMTMIATGFGDRIALMKQQPAPQAKPAATPAATVPTASWTNTAVSPREMAQPQRETPPATELVAAKPTPDRTVLWDEPAPRAAQSVREPEATPPRIPAPREMRIERPMSQQSTIRDIFEEIQRDQAPTPRETAREPEPDTFFAPERTQAELRVNAPAVAPTPARSKFDALFENDDDNAYPKSAADESEGLTDRFLKSSKRAFEEESIFAKKPANSWGTGLQDDSDPSAMAPRITRRRAESTQEKSEFKKIISDIGLNDADADEFDIPAFIRRRAD